MDLLLGWSNYASQLAIIIMDIISLLSQSWLDHVLIGSCLQTVEILTVINELKIGKSPGLDGIPIEFYYWDDLKDILLQLFTFILDNNIMSNEQKKGLSHLYTKEEPKLSLKTGAPSVYFVQTIKY